jgi:ribosomal protein L30/L7E
MGTTKKMEEWKDYFPASAYITGVLETAKSYIGVDNEEAKRRIDHAIFVIDNTKINEGKIREIEHRLNIVEEMLRLIRDLITIKSNGA